MKKKLLVTLLSVAMVASVFAGCGAKEEAPAEAPAEEAEAPAKAETPAEAPAEDDKIVIGCTMQGDETGFVHYLVSGIYDYQEKEAPDVEVQMVFADYDAATQLSQVETFVSQGVDAIIINPVDMTQSATCVDFAAEAGVPILTVNTGTDSENNTAHVGSDDVESGYLEMQYLLSVAGENAKVAYVDATLGHSAQIARAEGFNKALAEVEDAELVIHDTANWSADETLKLVENWVQAGQEMDIIAHMCDNQCFGTITALENAGLTGKILLGGIDCDPLMMGYVEDGTVACTVWQDGIGQGYHAMRLAIEAAKGNEIADYLIPFELVTKDNLADYEEKAAARDALAAKYF